MPTKRDARYAAALDELDAQRATGRVSQNAYDMQRAKLLTEAAKQPWPWSVRVLVSIGVIVAFFLGLRFLVAVLQMT